MKNKIFIIFIIIFAAVLRLYSLTTFPAGLNADEAALGYNAYSLLQTGRDEHSHIFPINLESFADYKPALYSYLLVPLIKLFGLSEVVVRLPSALFGILSVYLIYVLAKLLNFRHPQISAVILAISPWHLHFSRGAWEVNVSTTLILLACIFFLRWQKQQSLSKLIIFAACLVLSMYTYQSSRVVAPLLGLGILLGFRKKLLLNLRQSFLTLIFTLIALIPLLFSVATSNAASRLSGVGILADEGPLNYVKEMRGQHSGFNAVLGKILHNRPEIYSLQFIKNYLSHFDGNFLFVNGDIIQRNRIPETGLLYFSDVILVVLGVIYLIRNHKSPLIWIWLLISPVASALTFQVPHALRAQNMVIPLTLISAAGLSFLLTLITNLKYKLLIPICYLLLAICYSWQFTRYLHEYYIHYPQTYPAAWEYGFKELVEFVGLNEDRYSRILVTNKYDQPYILFLFYSKYDPKLFQNHHQLTVRDKYNFSTVNSYAKYTFTDTNWTIVSDIHSSLIIASPDDIPPVGVNIVKTINFPNGQPAFKIISN